MPIADLFKPYLWLAAIGFAVGFLSYVAMTPAASSAVTVDLTPAAAWASAASAPASSDWNFPKEI